MQIFSWLTSILSSDVGGLLIGLIRRSLGLQEDHEQLRDVLKRLRSLESRANGLQKVQTKLALDIQAIALGRETNYEQINALKSQLAACEVDLLELRKLLTQEHELTFEQIETIFERLGGHGEKNRN